MNNNTQSVTAKEEFIGFRCGTGKDAQVFIRVSVDEDGERKIYNVPLLTLASIQVFTSKPKIGRYAFGSANPRGMSKGIRSVNGIVNAHILNVGILEHIKEKLKGYTPVEARYLTIDEDMIVSLEQLNELTYLDELPPVDINMFITNPNTGGISSFSVKGVSFKSSEEAVGNGATIIENIQFIARDITPLRYEEISQEA